MKHVSTIFLCLISWSAYAQVGEADVKACHEAYTQSTSSWDDDPHLGPNKRHWIETIVWWNQFTDPVTLRAYIVSHPTPNYYEVCFAKRRLAQLGGDVAGLKQTFEAASDPSDAVRTSSSPASGGERVTSGSSASRSEPTQRAKTTSEGTKETRLEDSDEFKRCDQLVKDSVQRGNAYHASDIGRGVTVDLLRREIESTGWMIAAVESDPACLKISNFRSYHAGLKEGLSNTERRLRGMLNSSNRAEKCRDRMPNLPNGTCR